MGTIPHFFRAILLYQTTDLELCVFSKMRFADHLNHQPPTISSGQKSINNIPHTNPQGKGYGDAGNRIPDCFYAKEALYP
jgi:hypothetical protein